MSRRRAPKPTSAAEQSSFAGGPNDGDLALHLGRLCAEAERVQRGGRRREAGRDRGASSEASGAAQGEADGAMDTEGDPSASVPSRGHAGQSGQPIHLNLVAMIDVVFLLLCYFMLSANFTLGERVYDIALPEATPGDSQAVADDPFALPERPIRVTVEQAGSVAADVRYAVDVPGVTIVDAADLHRWLSTNRVGEGNSSGLFLPDTPIFIQPATGTEWQYAVEAFNAAVRAEYTVIRFVQPGG